MEKGARAMHRFKPVRGNPEHLPNQLLAEIEKWCEQEIKQTNEIHEVFSWGEIEAQCSDDAMHFLQTFGSRSTAMYIWMNIKKWKKELEQ